jgi:hypothetical protein
MWYGPHSTSLSVAFYENKESPEHNLPPFFVSFEVKSVAGVSCGIEQFL